MEKLDNTFQSFSIPATYHRVDGIHPLDLYIGIDEEYRWTLLLVSSIEPPAVESSRMIFAQKGKRDDGRWTLSLSLINNDYKDIFLLFANDIVSSSRVISNKNKAVSFICRRYKEWREMLANSRSSLLSDEQIKGLLGEMYILHNYLSEIYGVEKAALSWTGPKKMPQDFIVDSTWYEVKTISSSRTDVPVSSINQLDCSNVGELVVVFADKTSVTNDLAINLNVLYNQILDSISDETVKSDFSSMLFQYGYFPRQEYETADYTFAIKSISIYSVDHSFPCIRRNDIPSGIVEAKYSLSLSSISSFLKE